MEQEEEIYFYSEHGRTLVNITSMDYIAPIEVSGISIGIGFGFLASFVALYVALASLLNHITRVKKVQVPRNAKVLFVLVGIFIGIQLLNVVVRIVSDFVTIRLRLDLEENRPITVALYVIYALLSTGSGYTMLLNFVTLFLVINYVQTIFLNTSYQVRAVSLRKANHLKKAVYIISGIFAISMFSIVSIVSLCHFLHLMGRLVPAIAVTISNTIGFLIGSCMLLFNVVFTVWSGVVVIRAIKKNTYRLSKRFVEVTKQKGFIKRQANPFLVTILLISAMVLCVLLQITAAGVATLAGGSESSGVKFVWQISTSLAVLVCSSLSMSMFYPMFIHAQSAVTELTFYHNKQSKAQETALDNNSRLSTTAPSTPMSPPFYSNIQGENINIVDDQNDAQIVCVSPTSPMGGFSELPLVDVQQTPDSYINNDGLQ